MIMMTIIMVTMMMIKMMVARLVRSWQRHASSCSSHSHPVHPSHPWEDDYSGDCENIRNISFYTLVLVGHRDSSHLRIVAAH